MRFAPPRPTFVRVDHAAIQQLRAWVSTCNAGVAFTGAGISTESGIPDFRSPGGLWSKYRPIDFGDFIASEEMRIEAWRRRFAMDDVLLAARPNQGHRALASLVERGRLTHVITQNIDELHQQSGVPDSRVIELHGSTMYAKCLTCERRHELHEARRDFEATALAPRCVTCGGLLKTATISFGQSMPQREMALAQAATVACDLFLAIGSSLVVFPAAGFPALAKQRGAKLVIINREPTELDASADLVIHDDIGPTLAAVADLP